MNKIFNKRRKDVGWEQVKSTAECVGPLLAPPGPVVVSSALCELCEGGGGVGGDDPFKFKITQLASRGWSIAPYHHHLYIPFLSCARGRYDA